jgi:hypothetical protein
MMICALRGTPFLYYGQELGLPDAEILPDRVVDVDVRDPERAPMPWRRPSQAGPGAGFTTGEPWLPVVADAERLCVEAQRRTRRRRSRSCAASSGCAPANPRYSPACRSGERGPGRVVLRAARRLAVPDSAELQLPPGTAQDREAIRSLEEALREYNRLGARRGVARTRRRLRQLGVRRRPWASEQRPAAFWASLTGIEQATARLVAEGLASQRIADQLFISTHTVVFHLR